MKFWDRFKSARKKKQPREEVPEVPQDPGPHMSVYYTYGTHIYRRPGDDPTVYFLNPSLGIKKKIVDKDGIIQDFPGVKTEEFWAKDLGPNALKPRICFRTVFEKYPGGRHIMIWQVQPDGRYWEDEDGFGMENEEEIRLFSFLDSHGCFTGEFEIYTIGNKKYFSRENE